MEEKELAERINYATIAINVYMEYLKYCPEDKKSTYARRVEKLEKIRLQCADQIAAKLGIPILQESEEQTISSKLIV